MFEYIYFFQESVSPPANVFNINSLSVLADYIMQSGVDGLFNKVNIGDRFDKRHATSNDV